MCVDPIASKDDSLNFWKTTCILSLFKVEVPYCAKVLRFVIETHTYMLCVVDQGVFRWVPQVYTDTVRSSAFANETK